MSDKSKGQSAVAKVEKVKIPKITVKVLALDEAGRAAWLTEKTKGLSAEVVNKIKARMVAALSGEKPPKKVNFKAAFVGRPYAELVQIRADLSEALKVAEQAEEETLNRIIAKAEQQKKDIAARKAAEAAEVAAAK